MIGFPIGLLYANAAEWGLHKYVLHGLGKDRKNFWSFHWHEHHRNSRRGEHIDPTYERSLLGWHSQSKEALGLLAILLPHAALAKRAPWFFGALCYGALRYYFVHKRSHQDEGWAREHLAWHYDHHMGPDQDANWCVTRPWFDWIMGTRKPYVGTPREAEDREKRTRLKARRAAAARRAVSERAVTETPPERRHNIAGIAADA